MPAFGPYELIDRIGAGGMGEIYLALLRRPGAFEKVVAIKRILPALSRDPEFVAMFDREARVAAQLNHQNIVHIYDYGREGDEAFIAMEYVDGTDLRTLLVGHVEPELSARLTVLIHVARALDYAHRCRDRHGTALGIVHRDVSPGNVLVSREGEVKLTDFGLVTGDAVERLSMGGEVKGKVAYMSPEQTHGDPVDARSDLFSWGVLAYELLAGRRPFEGALLDVLTNIRAGRFSPLTDDNLPDDLVDLVNQCLRVHREERPQQAAELLPRLETVMRNLGTTDGTAQLAAWVQESVTKSRDPLDALAHTEVGADPIRPIQPSTAPDDEPSSAPRVGEGGSGHRRRRLSRRSILFGGAGLAGLALAIMLITTPQQGPRGPSPELATPLSAEVPETPEPAPPFEPERPSQSVDGPARLIVRTRPSGALLTLDGTGLGPVPQELAWAEPGEHRVRLSADGYRPYETTVVATNGMSRELDVALDPMPRLLITGEPEGARVSLTLDSGRRLSCEAPCDLAVDAGPGMARVEAPGFEPFEQILEAELPDRLEYTLRPLEQTWVASWGSDGLELSGDRRSRLTRELTGQTVQFRAPDGSLQGAIQTVLRQHGERVQVDLSVRSEPWSEIEFAGTTSGGTPAELSVDLGRGRHALRLRPRGGSRVHTLRLNLSRQEN